MLVSNIVVIENGFQSCNLFVEISRFLSFSMTSDKHEFQIFYYIMSLVTVSMMYYLVSLKRSTKMSCHNKTMFKNSRRTIVFLAHAYTKYLIFFREARHNKRNISFGRYGSGVHPFISRISAWWLGIARSTKAAKVSSSPASLKDGISVNPSLSAAGATDHSKSHCFLIDNSVFVPKDSAAFEQTNILRIDLSGNSFTHWTFPFFYGTSVIVAENIRMCGG